MAEKPGDKIKDLIQRFFEQFTIGCGNPDCSNKLCASSNAFEYKTCTRDELAARSLLAIKSSMPLCSVPSVAPNQSVEEVVQTVVQTPAVLKSEDNIKNTENFARIISDGATYENVSSFFDFCKRTGNLKILSHFLNRLFSDPDLLQRSFRSATSSEPVSEKQESETCENQPGSSPPVSSLEDIGKVYKMIDSLQGIDVRSTMAHAFHQCLNQILLLQESSAFLESCDITNLFTILLRYPIAHQQTDTLPSFHVQMGGFLEKMPISFHGKLSTLLSNFDSAWLRHHILQIQTCITDTIMVEGEMRKAPKSSTLLGLLGFAKIIFYACLLKSLRNERVDAPAIVDDTLSDAAILNDPNSSDLLRYACRQYLTSKNGMLHDPLATELGIANKFPHEFPVNPSDFVNSLLNEVMELEREHGDFLKVNGRHGHSSSYSAANPDFSFYQFPFIMDTQQKHNAVFYDNVLRQRQEMRESYMRSLIQQQHDYFRSMSFYGSSPMSNRPDPHLRFVISRDRIVDDTLMQLEHAASDNLSNLKKRLYIVFEGEPGVDEGGVQKEFFQLIVDRVLSPEYGMFVQDPETKLYWFNPMSHDYNEYFLIGFIFGLAIYNSCILNVSFPSVLFRKLLGLRGCYFDLKQSHPTLARSLQQLLDHEDDVESEFLLTFQISFTDVFGHVHTIDLKENGENCPVNNENRQEFVELYADTILNRLISAQFTAFQLGWQMVTSTTILSHLVRPDELELVICGQPNAGMFTKFYFYSCF